MRFEILFATACLFLGATVQGVAIPDRGADHLVSQAESIQGNEQYKDPRLQGGVAVAKRSDVLAEACNTAGQVGQTLGVASGNVCPTNGGATGPAGGPAGGPD